MAKINAINRVIALVSLAADYSTRPIFTSRTESVAISVGPCISRQQDNSDYEVERSTFLISSGLDLGIGFIT